MWFKQEIVIVSGKLGVVIVGGKLGEMIRTDEL